jgi:hypothetical protein
MKWENIKLGDSATFINGYPFKPTEWSDVGLPISEYKILQEIYQS